MGFFDDLGDYENAYKEFKESEKSLTRDQLASAMDEVREFAGQSAIENHGPSLVSMQSPKVTTEAGWAAQIAGESRQRFR